jgi:hypothetical protein
MKSNSLDFGLVASRIPKSSYQPPTNPPSLCRNPDGSVSLLLPPEDVKPTTEPVDDEENDDEFEDQFENLDTFVVILPPGSDAFDEVRKRLCG